MRTLIVVDDEVRHRRGLANMIRCIRPQYQVVECRNGLEAYEVIQSNGADIVISDIRMPVMDGLKLMEMLGARVKETKMIFLTSYAYFEYAQKAIGLGAFDYIVKPVDEEIVRKMLEKAELQLEAEHKSRLEKEALSEQLSSTFQTYVERQFNNWIQGRGEADLARIRSYLPKPDGCAVYLMSLETKDGASTVGHRTVLDVIHEQLDSIAPHIEFPLDGQEPIMAGIVNLPSEEMPLLQELMRNSIARINQLQVEIHVTIGLGGWCRLDEVSLSYQQAKTALEYGFYISTRNKWIPHESIRISRKDPELTVFSMEAELQKAVREADGAGAAVLFQELLSGILEDGYPEPYRIKQAVYHLLLRVMGVVRSYIPKEDYEEQAYRLKRMVNGCGNHEELVRIALNSVAEVMDTLERLRKNKKQNLIQQCLRYMEEHYDEDLSLESLAAKFHFNISYFSNMLKKETGNNFSQHLLMIRLRRAKQLLSETTNKVYEISVMVGYKDVKYFNRVFKKELGVSPEEYRKLNLD